MNLKKIILCGLFSGVAAFIVGSALYMNPLTSGVYAQYAGFAGSKPMAEFGGVANWLALMFAGGLVASVFTALLYSYAEKGFAVIPAWKKGLAFGFVLFLVAKLPASYYSWLLYSYPDTLNAIETFNGLVGGLVGGIVLAVAWDKIN